MESANRIISLLLGLVVVVVFVALLTGRLDVSSRLQALRGQISNEDITPTQTPLEEEVLGTTQDTTPNETIIEGLFKQRINPTATKAPERATNIPNTGTELFAIPALLLMLLTGVYLSRLR